MFMIPLAFLNYNTNRQKEILKRNDYFNLLIIGVIGGGLAPFLFFEGLNKTTASDASVLEGGELLFTAMIALIFFKERLTKIGYIGIFITIIGIISISFLSTTNSSHLFNFKLNFGDVLIILSTLCWGLDNNVSKMISKKITNTAKIVMIKSLIGAILLLVISYLSTYRLNVQISHLPYLLFLGIGGFGLSLFFFIESLRIIGTLKTITIFSTSAIFGLILSHFLLNEKIGILQIIATVLVLVGLYFVNKDELYYLKKHMKSTSKKY